MKIAIIPARSGSKRIHNKNIKKFNGKPIISYSIKNAINSKLFDTVIVSTDSKKIANIAIKYGAKVPFIRPKKISDDKTRITDVIKHTLLWYQKRNIKFSYACCIYAANPLLELSYLKKGYKELLKSNKKFSLSITKYNHPVQRSMFINKSGNLQPFKVNNIKKRTQDLKTSYHDAGQFIWGKVDAFIKSIEPLSAKSLPIIIPSYKVCDLDDIEDFKRTEIIYKYINQ